MRYEVGKKEEKKKEPISIVLHTSNSAVSSFFCPICVVLLGLHDKTRCLISKYVNFFGFAFCFVRAFPLVRVWREKKIQVPIIMSAWVRGLSQ